MFIIIHLAAFHGGIVYILTSTVQFENQSSFSLLLLSCDHWNLYFVIEFILYSGAVLVRVIIVLILCENYIIA